MGKEEKTLVLVKPDGVKRGLVGEILSRFERRGLKVISLEMLWAQKSQVDDHYPHNPNWIKRIGEKTLQNYQSYHLDPIKELGTNDPERIGKIVRDWLLDYLTMGPMVKIVIEGNHAISMVRKIVGDTAPSQAVPGTIRGDFSIDDAAKANREKRPIYNIIHASENEEEAQHELNLWTSLDDVFDYSRQDIN